MRVSGPAEFLQAIALSQSKRITKDNGINPLSSRSHHVFQVKINSYDRSGKPTVSMLNIVDLAGSERRASTLGIFDDEFIPKKKPSKIKRKETSVPSKSGSLIKSYSKGSVIQD